jgi:hypothetical protein
MPGPAPYCAASRARPDDRDVAAAMVFHGNRPADWLVRELWPVVTQCTSHHWITCRMAEKKDRDLPGKLTLEDMHLSTRASPNLSLTC